MKMIIKRLMLFKIQLKLITVFCLFAIGANAQCSFENLSYIPNTVKGDEVVICYSFTTNQTTSENYEVLFNDQKVKTATYATLFTDACFTLSKKDFLSQNTLKVQDERDKTCQAELSLELVFGVYTNGLNGGCYGNFKVEKLACEDGGDYYIQLFFEETLMRGEGSFILKANNELVGNFKYSELPLKLGPYKGDHQIDLTFDDLTEYCGGNIQLLSGACENTVYPCSVDNITTSLETCPGSDKKAFLQLNFDRKNTTADSFYLYYYYEDSSVDSLIYKYTELPLTIGPLAADGRTAYGICVADANDLNCKNHIYLNEISCVLPGDADVNESSLINHFDLLNIGEAFGANGPSRFGESNTDDDIDFSPAPPQNIFAVQAAKSWQQNFRDGLNYKHADCNGDGVVNRKDAVLIENNYNFDQPLEGEYNFLEKDEKGIPMGVSLPNEKMMANTTVELPITFGTKAMPVEGLYGLAFSLNLDTNVVSVQNIEVDFSESWLGNDGDPILSLSKFNEESGQLDIGLTKTNANSIFGYGNIATLRIIILIEIEPEKRASNFFSVDIDNILISTKSDGFEQISNQGVNILSDRAQIVAGIGNHGYLPQNLNLYPTIANQSFFVEKKDHKTIECKIFDLIGNTVYHNNIDNHLTTINTNQWVSGLYCVNFIIDNQTYSKRILIQH